MRSRRELRPWYPGLRATQPAQRIIASKLTKHAREAHGACNSERALKRSRPRREMPFLSARTTRRKAARQCTPNWGDYLRVLLDLGMIQLAKVTGFERPLERFVEALQHPNHGLTTSLHREKSKPSAIAWRYWVVALSGDLSSLSQP